MKEEEILKSCLNGSSAGFEELYKRYSPKMMAVCLRYESDFDNAKDLLQEGFIKVFENLHKYKNEGSLEGWIRKIFVNNALNYYQKNLKIAGTIERFNINDENNLIQFDESILSSIANEDLLKLIQSLPPAYKIVFNLYVIEGFKHQEIADKLGIQVGTSKSNLQDARLLLQKKIIATFKEAKKYNND